MRSPAFAVLPFVFLLLTEDGLSQTARVPLCGSATVNDSSVRAAAWEKTQLRFPQFMGKGAQPAAPKLHVLGVVDTFWVYNFVTGSFDRVAAELKAVGTVSYVWVSLEELQNQHVDSVSVLDMLTALESRTPRSSRDSTRGIVPLDRDFFGDPPNVNSAFTKGAGDGKTHFLVTDIKDSWMPNTGGGYVAGFFFDVDVDPNSSFPQFSNRRDMLYIDSYPGIYFNGTRNVEQPLSTLSHEFQHLIQWNYDPDEIAFFNEGLSEYASYVCGYGLRSPSGYFQQPNVPLVGWSSSLEDYSRAALWTLYCAEQYGDAFVRNFVRNPSAGSTGFDNALSLAGIGSSFTGTVRNFHIANIVKRRQENPAFGYLDSSATEGRPRFLRTLLGAGSNGTRSGLQPLAADYLRFLAAETLQTTVTQTLGSVAVKGVKVSDQGVTAADVTSGVPYETMYTGSQVSEFLLVVQNAAAGGGVAGYTFNSTGTARTSAVYELAYDDGVSQISPNMNLVVGDTVFVRFEGIEGGIVDSIAMWFGSFGGARLMVRDYNLQYDFFNSPLTGFGGKARMFSPVGFTVSDTGYMKTVVPLRQFAIASSPDFVVGVIYQGPVNPMLRRDSSQALVRSYLSLSAQPQSGRVVYQSLGDFYLRAYLSPAGANPPTALPSGFALLQNYPNPFNPSTVITYDLPVRSHVKLVVFDLLGREVALVIDAEEDARRHTAVFDASRLSAGVYFYRLTTPSFTETKKMILLH